MEQKPNRKTGLLECAACPPLTLPEAPTHSHVVLFVHFDGLVGLSGDQSAFWVVKHAGEDARLAVQGTGLHGRMDALEVVPGPPVPQVDGSIVGYEGWKQPGLALGPLLRSGFTLITDTSWHQDAVGVHGERVDDSVVTRQVLDEIAIWEHPLFDVVSRTGSKSVSREDTTALGILLAEVKSEE